MEDELRRIADRIRRWRVDAGLTLQDVASSAGVSASTVHKIENLQTIPTISVLLKVAHGLRRRPHELFDSAGRPADVALTRSADRDTLQTREGAQLERVVGGIEAGAIDVWRVTHAPGFGSRSEPDAPPLRYKGELIILVEAGSLHVTVADQAFVLDAGDTLHFKTSLPHFWENRGEDPMTALFFGLLTRAANPSD